VYDIFYAARRGDSKAVLHFLETKDSLLSAKDRYGNTPLYYACLCGHPSLVSFLLIQGANFDIHTPEGERCYLASLTDEIRRILLCGGELFAAVRRGDSDAVKELVTKSGTSLDSLDDHGLSPVHYAALHGHQDIVEFLEHKGFHRSLTSDLRKEFNNRSLCDITFRVEGKVFYAHRALLKVRAPNFYRMINERFLYEARLDKISWKAFEGFMEHLYTGRVNFVENLRVEIANFAKLYHVPFDLKKKENSLLQRDMMNLLKTSSDFGDVILISQDEQRFYSHRFVLAARSEYFRAMFSGSFKESYHQEISLSGISSDCLRALLKFLYTDTIEDPYLADNQTAIDLIGFSDQFFFLGACQKFL